MEISEDPEKIKEWVPLMMEGRQSEEPIAITYDETGTDVNFGALTKKLISNLQDKTLKLIINTKFKILRNKIMAIGMLS